MFVVHVSLFYGCANMFVYAMDSGAYLGAYLIFLNCIIYDFFWEVFLIKLVANFSDFFKIFLLNCLHLAIIRLRIRKLQSSPCVCTRERVYMFMESYTVVCGLWYATCADWNTILDHIICHETDDYNLSVTFHARVHKSCRLGARVYHIRLHLNSVFMKSNWESNIGNSLSHIQYQVNSVIFVAYQGCTILPFTDFNLCCLYTCI